MSYDKNKIDMDITQELPIDKPEESEDNKKPSISPEKDFYYVW